jgi:hypothetical protein
VSQVVESTDLERAEDEEEREPRPMRAIPSSRSPDDTDASPATRQSGDEDRSNPLM